MIANVFLDHLTYARPPTQLVEWIQMQHPLQGSLYHRPISSQPKFTD